MKKMTKSLLTLCMLCIVPLAHSCKGVDKLSDENRVASFKVNTYQPTDIVLGDCRVINSEDVELGPDGQPTDPSAVVGENIIVIPVTYFPGTSFSMEFTAEMTFVGKIDQIAGADMTGSLTLTDKAEDAIIFTVVAESGMPRRYKVVPEIEAFNIPSELPLTVKSILQGSADDINPVAQVVVSESKIVITATNVTYPFKMVPLFDIDEDAMAFIDFRNGMTTLTFNQVGDTQTIIIEDKINGTKKDFTVVISDTSDVLTINSFSSTFTLADIVVIEEGEDGSGVGDIIINLAETGSCPVTIDYFINAPYGSEISVPVRGTHTFTNLNDTFEFLITGSDARVKKWIVKFGEHATQLKNWELNEWVRPSWSSYHLYPAPQGVQSAPYWSNANMQSPVRVEVTKRTDSPSGISGDYAAELKTGNVFGRKAAGSLYTGWFDNSDPIGNLGDPQVMTFQGIPFSSTKKILGITVDFSYSAGGADNSDTGVITVDLVQQRSSAARFEYHGTLANGAGHAKNNADLVARGRIVIGHIEEGHQAENNDIVTKKVTRGTWNKDVHIPISYESSTVPAYSHFVFICSSSSKGDELSNGSDSAVTVGSTLIVDNIRIIYED